MPWHASLRLHYRRDDDTTRAHAEHEGPLRVLKALYPEGAAICHHTVLHPPSGIVGGDVLDLALTLEENAHAVLTTPGASRFYRCEQGDATQTLRAVLQAGARLEWLPQENIAYSGTRMRNRQHFRLAPGAEMMGCDVLALGLPASQLPFVAGGIVQSIEIQGVWLERARIAADDHLLLHSPLGLAGQTALATLWWAGGNKLADARVTAALDAARALLQVQVHDTVLAGVTQVHPQVVVLRALARQTEPLTRLLRAVRAAWRASLWALPAIEPRVWTT